MGGAKKGREIFKLKRIFTCHMGYMHLFLEPSQVLLHDLTGAHHSIQEPEVKIIEYINANAVASTEISNNKIKNG